MSVEIPEGSTHEHKGNDDWLPHFIKVVNANEDDEEVFQWLALRPEWGHWSDIPAYDKDNKENYIEIVKQSNNKG
jgi:hypothetical protein